MSEDIRKMIDKVKNFKQFVKENVSRLKEISLDDAIRLTQEDDVKNVYYSLLGNDNEKWVDKSEDDIQFYLSEEPINLFTDQILEMESISNEGSEDYDRVLKIYDILKNGGKPKPVFVELNDRDKFVIEGRHRMVAFKWIGLKYIPIIYVQ
jgi:hypothetical protein